MSEESAAARTVVIKLGSSTITCDGRLNTALLTEYAKVSRALIDQGWRVVLVSSGAVAAGRQSRPQAPSKPMLAALGQPRLMRMYAELFSIYQLEVAQLLLTRHDLEARVSYLNARQTLQSLLREPGIVPIINENDSVATEEIRVGDNDQLSALLASLIDAEALLLMTDQIGLFSADPRSNPDAHLITEISEDPLPESVWQMAQGKAGQLGTGGMTTKLKAADIARRNGVSIIIAEGARPMQIPELLAGGGIGTRITALDKPKEARKRYILSGLRSGQGLRIDAGAARALQAGRSLLGVGVVQVQGEFERGDTLDVIGPEGVWHQPLARGIANYSAADMRRMVGLKSSEIEAVLGIDFGAEFIHRNDMVLL
jgi:glutamate 5-kinase